MSVPNQTPYNIYTANGLTTVFAYQFMIMNAGDIEVSINGTPQTSGYTVQGAGQTGGGQVVFMTPPANGSVVMLLRKLVIKRDTDYQDNGDLLAETINADFDRLWLAMQQAFLSDSLSLKRPLLGGDYNAGNLKIINLKDPTAKQDAATKGWVDLQYSIPTSEAKQAAAEAKEARDESREIADKFGDVDAAITAAESARDAAAEYANESESSAQRAETAAESAEAIADTSNTYSSIAEGLANTSNGQYFRVIQQSGSRFLFIYYKNVSGSAVSMGSAPSGAFVEELYDTNAATLATDTIPGVAELKVDEEGKIVLRRHADGTTQVPALMVGTGFEFVQLEGDGFSCRKRGSDEEIFRLAGSGSLIRGSVTSWTSDNALFDGYAEIHMDNQGRIFRRVLDDGTVEQVGEVTPDDDDTSTFPVVASVNDNIIAVKNDVITPLTNDTGVSNIAPVAQKTYARFLSDISGEYRVHRVSYDGKYRVREQLRVLIHLIATGQSLSPGGSTVPQSPVTTAAQADFGILAFGTGPKVDFRYDTLDESLLEFVIPCRENTGTRPNQESPSSGMAWQIHEITGHTVIVTTAGSSGTAISGISAGTPAFLGATEMIKAAAEMAKSLGMEYVPVLAFIHGNQDAANGTAMATYRTAMENLRIQYQTVINTATGGNYSLNMFIGQLSNIIPYGGSAGTTRTNTIGVAQYQEARDNDFIHLASAQYARPYSDGEHLTSAGYRTEGEVLGSVIGNWINDNTWSSMVPDEAGIVQSGTTITIPIKGCIGAPVIDTTRVSDPGNYGIVLTGATIATVTVTGSGSGAQIVITKTDSSVATAVAYAHQGIAGQNPGSVTGSRGCIRDSKPGVSLSGLPLYNDLCVFSITL